MSEIFICRAKQGGFFLPFLTSIWDNCCIVGDYTPHNAVGHAFSVHYLLVYFAFSSFFGIWTKKRMSAVLVCTVPMATSNYNCDILIVTKETLYGGFADVSPESVYSC